MDRNLSTRWETVSYIQQMLAELRDMAAREQFDMLAYLIEMAYMETGEILEGQVSISDVRQQRDGSA
ncbi:MAG: hypothetical protein ACRECW_07945 [Phyllobacterium sp.]